MDQPAVFIVEADQAMCHVLETTLAAWGMHTKSILRSPGVIDEVKEHVFNLVLLDLEMPRLNRLDVLARLRDRSPRTKVIAMVSDTEQEKALEALAHGVWGVFCNVWCAGLPLTYRTPGIAHAAPGRGTSPAPG